MIQDNPKYLQFQSLCRTVELICCRGILAWYKIILNIYNFNLSVELFNWICCRWILAWYKIIPNIFNLSILLFNWICWRGILAWYKIIPNIYNLSILLFNWIRNQYLKSLSFIPIKTTAGVKQSKNIKTALVSFHATRVQS